MKYELSQILDLYQSEAEKHGPAGTSTIQDIRTRQLEMDAIFSYMRDGIKVLEIGCGNGYVAQALIEKFNIDLEAFDFTPAFIEIAKSRDLKRARGKVCFFQQDVLELNKHNTYDLVFTERVIQNLINWEQQVIALKNISKCLKTDGIFIMEECFWTGLNNLNAARKELELEKIQESWHNLYFHEEKVKELMSELNMEFVEQNCFLSGYYFGSRVLLPALMPKGKKINSASILNDYFCTLPAKGDFSPMKILVFRKQ